MQNLLGTEYLNEYLMVYSHFTYIVNFSLLF
jgi:hypothetical protein